MKRGIALTAMALALSAASGWICGQGSVKPEPTMAELRITEDMRTEISIKYLYCSHNKSVDPTPFLGMTRDEFGKSFSGRIYEFSEENVRAVKYVSSYCPEHTVLKADEYGGISIMRFNADGILEKLYDTGFSLRDVEPYAAGRVRQGIVISGGSVDDALESVLKKRKTP